MNTTQIQVAVAWADIIICSAGPFILASLIGALIGLFICFFRR